jgi:broad specificity phosphatase PhoE
LASDYVRPQQTAEEAGFEIIHVSDLISEADIGRINMSGREVITKHAQERWSPEETSQRAANFIELVRKGELDHQIYFSHGVFIASVLLQLSNEAAVNEEEFPHQFDERRGFIPPLATIIPVEI